jgi:hypothetical protein
MTTDTAGGQYNIAIGNYALDALGSGDNNTAIGYQAGSAATSAGENTFVGYHAGLLCVDGLRNTFVGATCGDALTSGTDNAGVGIGSLTSLVDGQYNTAMGRSSGQETTTGDRNTYVGNDAGSGITTGSHNVMLGNQTGATGSPGGAFSGSTSNKLVIGANEIDGAHVQVDWTVASDKRDKTDVEAVKMGLDFVNKLEPVTYQWDKRTKYVDNDDLINNKIDLNTVVHDGTHKEDWRDVGFLAQDVEKLEEEYGHKMSDKTNLTTYMSEDGAYGLTYAKFVPILTKAVQELSAKVEAQQSEIDALKNA